MKVAALILILIFAAGFTYGILHSTNVFKIAALVAIIVGLLWLGTKVVKND